MFILNFIWGEYIKSWICSEISFFYFLFLKKIFHYSLANLPKKILVPWKQAFVRVTNFKKKTQHLFLDYCSSKTNNRTGYLFSWELTRYEDGFSTICAVSGDITQLSGKNPTVIYLFKAKNGNSASFLLSFFLSFTSKLLRVLTVSYISPRKLLMEQSFI